MTTDPIIAKVTEGDTHPVMTWTMKLDNGSPDDLTSPNKSVTLYYFDAAADDDAPALWKKVLTKSGTPTDGKVSFTASASEPFCPVGLIALRDFPRETRGKLRYVDTGAVVPVDVWIDDALRLFVKRKLAEPA